MKKLLFLFLLTLAVNAVTLAQGGPGMDPAAMKQRMKERVKPQLIEKTKITDDQAEKVLDINFEVQRQRREIRMDANLTDEEKKKKNEAIDEDVTKRYKAIPLKDEEIKAVHAFFDEMRKNAQQRREGGNR